MIRHPYELLVLGLPADDLQHAVREVIEQVVGMTGVSIVDALLVVKSAGSVTGTVEIIGTPYDPGLRTATPGLIGHEDVAEIGSILALDGRAVALLVEHVWATHLAAGIKTVRGQWVASVPVPAEHVWAVAARAGDGARTADGADSGGAVP